MRFAALFAHLDADTPGFSAFIDRALDHIMTEVFNTELPPLKGKLYVPIRSTTPPGAKTVTYRQYTRAGLAQWITDYGHDLPTVSFWVKEFTTSIHKIGDQYMYTIEDLLASMMASANGQPVNVDMELAAAALIGIEQKLDRAARVGTADGESPDLGLVGLLNLPNATIFTVPAGSSGGQAFSGKTPDEIANDLFAIASAQVETTFEVEAPNSILLPLAQHGLVVQRRMGDGSDTTIKDFVLKNSPWITAIDPWSFLKNAGTSTSDRMVCYNRNPAKLWHEVPIPFRQEPPQLQGLAVKVPCWAKSGGVICPKPLSVSYGDHI